MTKRKADSSTQSTTDLLSDALNELIEKKLYTILGCSADNVNDCILKPGPKGNKGEIGDQGKDGRQGSLGNPGVKGDKGQDGLPGHKGEVGPRGPVGDPGTPGNRGVKGDMGDIGPIGRPGIKGERGERGVKGQHGYPGYKGDPGVKGEKGEKGILPNIRIPSVACGGAGWRRVTFLDMTNPTQKCPNGLKLTGYSKRTCGRVHTGTDTCSSSIFFPVGGRQYSQVCGRAKAYQWGSMHSFFNYNAARSRVTLNKQYVDGLSFTHGRTSRTHIWTFAAGINQVATSYSSFSHCPCNGGANPPPFVGDDYFCETGNSFDNKGGRQLYLDDPLWDGHGCIRSNQCCQYNDPPWFYKTLPTPTTDDIEMRMCISHNIWGADIALEQLEIYVY